MPKILLAECKQEVSTFNPVLSRRADFIISAGEQIVSFHQVAGTEMGGALNVFAQHADVELVPTYSIRAITSAGTLAADDWTEMANEFLDAIRAAPAVDAVYLSIHGAMAAQNEVDPEGYLLAEMRKILGGEIPIVASMDLHGIVTDRIFEESDAIVAYHTYPHVDFYETGQRAARLLLHIINENVQPVTTLVPIPALVRGDELITEIGLFGRAIRAAQVIEASKWGLSAGMFIGNPFTDVPDLRSNVFIVADGRVEGAVESAQQEALRIANEFWDVRHQLQAPLDTLDDAIEIAKRATGSVILTDAADATSSGASGDSNAILRKLFEKEYAGSVLMPIVDPGAVQAAKAAGIGQTIHTTLGGALDPRFEPIEVEAVVRMLSDGTFINESHGTPWFAGDSAVLQICTITVIATSRPVSLYDRSLFYAHGQDPMHFDAIVVKSPHSQPQFFADWAEHVINIDAPGSTSANLPNLGHTVCARPIFPLDDDVIFRQEIKTFQRLG